MVLVCWDTKLNQKVDIDNLPHKQNDIFNYKKWRREKRYACIECGTNISLVDAFTNTSKFGQEFFVRNHFRCNNPDCQTKKELKDKKRTNNIGKKGETKAQLQERHNKFLDRWLRYFDINYIYLDEGIKIPQSKTILIFSYLLITFDIIRKIKTENIDFKIIIIFDEDAKCRTIQNLPSCNEKGYSIYLPKKNDIQYCLEYNFQVYLDLGEDTLLQLFDNNSNDCCFDVRLVFINDLSFKTGIFNHQIKPIYRKHGLTIMPLFIHAKEQYENQVLKEMEMKIKANERKEFLQRRNLLRRFIK